MVKDFTCLMMLLIISASGEKTLGIEDEFMLKALMEKFLKPSGKMEKLMGGAM